MRILLPFLACLMLVGCTAAPPAATGEQTGANVPPTAQATLTAQPSFTLFPTRTSTPTPTLTPQPTGTHTPTALPSPTPVCAGAPPSYLAVGRLAMVNLTSPVSSRLREHPNLEGKIVGQAQAGQEMEILAGPECADGYVWWQVRLLDQNLVGWTVEGDASGPWLITPTPAPTLTQTPLPGKCPPYPVQISLPNPLDPADADSYLGKVFQTGLLPPELLFQRGTVVELQQGYVITQVEVKSSHQVLLWLEKRACRDAAGQAFAVVVDALVLPPLGSDQQLIVSSVNRCFIQDEYDPLLVALAKVDLSQPATQQVRDIQRAWRVDLEGSLLYEVSTKGMVCEVYLGGP